MVWFIFSQREAEPLKSLIVAGMETGPVCPLLQRLTVLSCLSRLHRRSRLGLSAMGCPACFWFMSFLATSSMCLQHDLGDKCYLVESHTRSIDPLVHQHWAPLVWKK